MKRKRKKILISLITSLGIAVSATGCKIAIDKTVPFYYRVNKSYEVTAEKDQTDKVISNYPALSNTLIDDSIKTYENSNMVPQGITSNSDYIFTSCYDGLGNNNSLIVTLDKETGNLVNICELESKAHVGGIAFDESNNLIWVSSNNGNVNAYYPDIIAEQYQAEPKYKDLNVGTGLKNYKCPWKNSVASLTIYNNTLYVGSFTTTEKGLVKAYKIVENEDKTKIALTYIKSFTIPPQVQGITFYNNGTNTYLLLSRSYGKHASSIIQIFKYDETISDYTENIPYIYYKAPSMLEQISVDEESLYTVYESAATKYQNGKEQVDTLHIFDLPKLTKKL